MNTFLQSFFFRIECFISKYRIFFLILIVVLLLLIPTFGLSRFTMRLIIMIGIYSMLTIALNIIAGYTGLLSMGNVGFYAIGAYTSTLLALNTNMSFWIAILIAGSFAAVSGFLLGLPTLRLRGAYLTIVTLGFGEIVRMVLMNWDSVTNGTMGIRNIPLPRFFGTYLTLANHGLYYLMIFLVFLVSLFSYLILNSKIGRSFIAIREDEIAAQMMGIQIVRYKVLAFVLSAFISGLAGAFYASVIRYIDPNSFTFEVSSLIITMAILGGLGTMRGMYFGAAVLVIFPEVFRFLTEFRFVMYGVILVLMMRYRPQGLLGWQSRLPYRFRKDVLAQIKTEGILDSIKGGNNVPAAD